MISSMKSINTKNIHTSQCKQVHAGVEAQAVEIIIVNSSILIISKP